MLNQKTRPALAYEIQRRDGGRDMKRLEEIDRCAGDDSDIAAARGKPVCKQHGIQPVAVKTGKAVFQRHKIDHRVETRNKRPPEFLLSVARIAVCAATSNPMPTLRPFGCVM